MNHHTTTTSTFSGEDRSIVLSALADMAEEWHDRADDGEREGILTFAEAEQVRADADRAQLLADLGYLDVTEAELASAVRGGWELAIEAEEAGRKGVEPPIASGDYGRIIASHVHCTVTAPEDLHEARLDHEAHDTFVEQLAGAEEDGQDLSKVATVARHAVVAYHRVRRNRSTSFQLEVAVTLILDGEVNEDGSIDIHRTRVLTPNVAHLSQAQWHAETRVEGWSRPLTISEIDTIGDLDWPAPQLES